MNFDNTLADQDNLLLKTAILIYEGQHASYASTHPIHTVGKKVMIGAGQPIGMRELEEVMQSLGKNVSEGFVSERLIYSSPGIKVWWKKSAIENMFIREDGEEAAIKVSHPSLVFSLSGSRFSVFAIKGDERPTATTALFYAPYFNVSENGSVCTGNAYVPDSTDTDSFEGWEKMFFNSYFTHPSNKKIIKSKKSFKTFWVDLSKSGERFADKALFPADMTIKEFVKEQENNERN